MRLIFSFNRAAQLDLLLHSLARNAEPEPTSVLARASTGAFRDGYGRLLDLWPGQPRVRFGDSRTFEADVWHLLHEADEYVTLLCDDDVLFAPAAPPALEDDEICFSWRLGANCRWCYPRGEEQPVPRLGEVQGLDRWRVDWQTYDGDFGYPGSLDGNTFRADDLRAMLAPHVFSNPTELEDALQDACRNYIERPLLACLPRSILCSVPVNKVSEQSQVRAGETYPAKAGTLNAWFLDGWRLSLDALDFSTCNAAHYERQLVWSDRP